MRCGVSLCLLNGWQKKAHRTDQDDSRHGPSQCIGKVSSERGVLPSPEVHCPQESLEGMLLQFHQDQLSFWLDSQFLSPTLRQCIA